MKVKANRLSDIELEKVGFIRCKTPEGLPKEGTCWKVNEKMVKVIIGFIIHNKVIVLKFITLDFMRIQLLIWQYQSVLV